jgi:hypothetical protein
MSKKTFLGNEINFNQPPVMWAGMEVYPGNGATSNLYGTLNVVKNPNEPIIPDINTDGNLYVKLNATIDENLRVNGDVRMSKKLRVDGQSRFNSNVRVNAKLLISGCGDVAKRINRADGLPKSDKNLKKNISPIKSALDKVMQLNGVEFDFINEKDHGHLYQHQIGLIAQDVQNIIPEVVAKNLDGNLGLSYQHLVPLLIEAIKEQQKQIDELKTKLVEN